MIYYSLVFTDFYTNTSLIKIYHIKMHIQIIHPRTEYLASCLQPLAETASGCTMC